MLTLPSFRSSRIIPQIIATVGELPASARLLPSMQRLLGDNDSSTADIVDLLRLDPTLTAKVISLANHAYFGGGQNCDTLDDAVCRLGFEEIYRLVATIAVQGVFNQEMILYGMGEGALMEESLAVGVSMPVLNGVAAVALRGDELFTIGLLHGLGKLALSAYARAKGEKRIIGRRAPSTVMKAEKGLFRATNPEVAAGMLEDWKFAPALVRIVRCQQDPKAAGYEAPAAALLRLAIALAPFVLNPVLHGEDARYLPEVEDIGIDNRKIPALLERSREMFELFSQR